MKISAANLRKLIREELFYREFHKDATTLVEQTGEQFMIAGRKISSATKEEIQSVFGGDLKWERLEEKRASRISYRITGESLLKNKDNWDDLQNKLVDAMARLEEATKEHIRNLN